MHTKLELAIRKTQEIMDLTPESPVKQFTVLCIEQCIAEYVARDASGAPMTPELEAALDHIINLGAEAKRVIGAAKAKVAAAQTTDDSNKRLN